MQQRFFIADLIACLTCFRHHYAHHQELKSIIQWLLRVVFCAMVFSSSWSGVELRVMRPVCRMLNFELPMQPIYQEKIQLSGFFAYTDGWPSQLIWRCGVLLYLVRNKE